MTAEAVDLFYLSAVRATITTQTSSVTIAGPGATRSADKSVTMITAKSTTKKWPARMPGNDGVVGSDLRQHGVRAPIVVLDGKILDGRSRYRAALAAGFLTEDDHPDDRPNIFVRFVREVDGDPIAFAFSMNVPRRHLTGGQRAWVIAQLEQFRPANDWIMGNGAR